MQVRHTSTEMGFAESTQIFASLPMALHIHKNSEPACRDETALNEETSFLWQGYGWISILRCVNLPTINNTIF